MNKRIPCFMPLAAIVFACSLLTAQCAPARVVPKTLPSRPGNIFLAGEEVSISLPANSKDGWRVVDYEERTVKGVAAGTQICGLGQLTPGFYRARPINGPSNQWISIGVLPRLKAPTPLTSPVGLDVAMAWFYGPEQMDAVANLCALAGVNWVRDRLAWGHMESKRGQFSSPNKYDAAAQAQARAGLQVLQVNHSSPNWANPNHSRFPTDLRDAYQFHREMAKRWKAQVPAFEPWNEADITMFGGHTGSEMASLQKASYLGLKEGNPDVIACWNVFAVNQKEQLEDVAQNEAWPYFDTFNLHHYSAFNAYPKIYADYRAISAGKPLWVTECAVPVKWAGDDRLKEPTEADLRVQAERIAKVYAHSLFEGSAMTFYFMLPHYVEGQTQFGILRPDLTPRPAFLALAAIGRLMPDAYALGQWTNANSAIRAFWFRAKPDGQERDLVLAWTDKSESTLELPQKPLAAYDHIGREIALDANVKIDTAPRFFVFPVGTAKARSMVAPPKPANLLEGNPSPIVFQAVFPTNKTMRAQSCYRILADQPEQVSIFAYNFGNETASGTLQTTTPDGWSITLTKQIEIAPGDKKQLILQVDASGSTSSAIETMRISGDFGKAGKPVLSLRLKREAAK